MTKEQTELTLTCMKAYALYIVLRVAVLLTVVGIVLCSLASHADTLYAITAALAVLGIIFEIGCQIVYGTCKNYESELLKNSPTHTTTTHRTRPGIN